MERATPSRAGAHIEVAPLQGRELSVGIDFVIISGETMAKGGGAATGSQTFSFKKF